MSAAATEQKKKDPAKKKKAGTVQKQSKRGLINQSSFIRKLAKQMTNKGDQRATAAAYEEIEHLMDYAMNSFTYNGSEVLKYTGAETFGLKTAFCAVQSALTGDLVDIAMDGGKQAVKTYAASMGNEPPSFPDDPPPPLEGVAA